ncbi:hypothetical protein ACFQ1S_02900 [Kibdelosporangium lantanae]|uniref:Uncharacterized protein n=1 Tax=Kibdelosporangium lantanae TaxID=1497396 RepID=A0ABW3M3Z7_9PSEU
MNGPDLPTPDELFDIDTWRHRWPTGTEKAELYAGILVFSGQFDQRDVTIAERTYPGRRVVLNDGGGIEVHPAGENPARSIFETFAEQVAQLRESENRASTTPPAST